jgi:hypothetical protein
MKLPRQHFLHLLAQKLVVENRPGAGSKLIGQADRI